MAKTTSSKKPNLTLHQLIGALSYWGTSVRVLLGAFLLLIGYIVTAAGVSDTALATQQLMIATYVFGALFALDFGYVIACRALPIKDSVDRLVLILVDLLLVSFYLIPAFVVVNTSVYTFRNTSLIIAILVLAMRLLLGFLFTNSRRV